MANQNTGVMSTPNAGGIFPFASLSKGSDGQATINQGNSFNLVSAGYHDATTLQSIAKDIKFKNGPNKVMVGCTHASVSATKNPLPDDNTVPTVSDRDVPTATSIIFKEISALLWRVALGIEEVEKEIGTTNAAARFIVNEIMTTIRNKIER